jgi:hypothetical protein
VCVKPHARPPHTPHATTAVKHHLKDVHVIHVAEPAAAAAAPLDFLTLCICITYILHTPHTHKDVYVVPVAEPA